MATDPAAHERELLRATFDAAAARYARARPQYPARLLDDLVSVTGLTPPASLLEVGCGPGTATLPLARRGFAITALELGPALAEQARTALAEFDRVEVVTAPFEGWRPPPGQRYDVVYAATAWHWLDPTTRWARAAEVLHPDGHLVEFRAGHDVPADPTVLDPFFPEIQRVYDDIEGRSADDPWRLAPELADDPTAEVEASGHFRVVAVRRYRWSLRYTADAYLDLLGTFSGHLAMRRADRDRLDREVRRILAARPDGRLTRHWVARMVVARRT